MTLVKRNDAFSKAFSHLTSFIFTRMSFLIPAERLRETDTLLAFHHPKPAYPFHVLLVPRQAIPNLMALDPSNAKFLSELFEVVQALVTEFQLPVYRLVVNGDVDSMPFWKEQFLW